MSRDELKMAAARAALDHVEDGMSLGIGSGSTAERFIEALAERVAGGLKVVGVPTSERSAALCRELGVPLVSLDDRPELDLAVDGADEFDRDLNLIKGGGGALLREKIVAAAARRMIVVADEGKEMDMLGRFPLPIEVNRFGLKATVKGVAEAAAELGLGGTILLRNRGGAPFETDCGHLILDASFGRIPDPRALSGALHAIPGVVEHGLFLGLAEAVIVARADGVATLRPASTEQESRS